MKTQKIKLTELRQLVKKIIKEEKTRSLIKESNVNVDIDTLISIAEKMGESKPNPKWNDYVNAFVDVFEFIELTDEQAEKVFNWFMENFPKAPNQRIAKLLPSLTYFATQYDAEGGWSNEKGWD
jgi:hypothetical protein